MNTGLGARVGNETEVAKTLSHEDDIKVPVVPTLLHDTIAKWRLCTRHRISMIHLNVRAILRVL